MDSGNRLGETGKNIDFSSGFKGAGRNSEFERNEAGYSNPKSGNPEKEYDHSSLDTGLHKNPQNDGNVSATPQDGRCGRTDVERYEEMVQKSGSSVSRNDPVSGREQGQKSFGAFRGTEYKNVWRSETGKTGDRSTDPGSGVKTSADSLRFGAGETGLLHTRHGGSSNPLYVTFLITVELFAFPSI